LEEVGENVIKEEWKQIKEAKEGYFVSNLGRVKNPKGLLIKSGDNGGGYRYIFYRTKENKSKRTYVHRLVAAYFLKSEDGCIYVNHKDLNKENNAADNLEWVTAKQNTAHGIKAGCINKKGRPHTIHSDEKIRRVYAEHIKGMTLCEIERVYGVNRSTLASIIRGDVRKSVLKGLTPINT